MKSKRLNYNDLTYSSFYQDTNQTQENIGNGTYYMNSGCRINTDGAGNIYLVESNADAKTIDNSLSVMRAFYQKSQDPCQQPNCQKKEGAFPFEIGQIATARRTTGNESTGHSSETTLAFNRSGIQLRCYDNSQFPNNSNMLFQITGQKMLNNKTGQVGMAGEMRSKKNKKANLQRSLVRKEKMRKYQNNYMIGTQKTVLQHKITPELCDRSISAKNSIEGGNSVESFACKARSILKAPLAVKQPKEIIIKIKKEQKGNISASQNDTIVINNEVSY